MLNNKQQKDSLSSKSSKEEPTLEELQKLCDEADKLYKKGKALDAAEHEMLLTEVKKFDEDMRKTPPDELNAAFAKIACERYPHLFEQIGQFKLDESKENKNPDGDCGESLSRPASPQPIVVV